MPIRDRLFGLLMAAYIGVVLANIVFLVCCAGTRFVPPPECEGSKSLILERIPDPAGASLVLQVANLELLKHNAYTKQEALEVIRTIEEYSAVENITYGDLVVYVLSRFENFNKEMGAEILLASQYLKVLNEAVPISPCDKALILAHLEKQRKVVLLCR